MKRLCIFAVLMMCASSAHAGGSYSFKLGSHRVHIEKSRHCRLHTCISVSKGMRSLDWGRKRIDDGRDVTPAPKPAPAAPQVVTPPPPAPPAPPVSTSPAKIIVLAPPPAVQTAAVTRSIAEPPPVETPSTQEVSTPSPPAAETVGSVRSAARTERASNPPPEESPDSPIGDWQTEGKGTVRIARCGVALCGHALTSANEKGEAILINMKPKTHRQWSGSVYSQGSGDTYYGTMATKGTDTLRVEACALYHFYCSGNNWSRISRRADSPAIAGPRS